MSLEKSDASFRRPFAQNFEACRVPAFAVSQRQAGMSTFLSQKSASQSLDSHSITSTTPAKPHHGDGPQTQRRRPKSCGRSDQAERDASARRRRSMGKHSHHHLPACAKRRVSTVEPATSQSSSPRTHKIIPARTLLTIPQRDGRTPKATSSSRTSVPMQMLHIRALRSKQSRAPMSSSR